MSSLVEFVSIDLRNLDGVILEGESDKENGGDGSRRAKGPAVEDILKSHNKAMHRWNTLFFFICFVAVFIDPLFCYIYVVVEDYMCFHYDRILLYAYLSLRTACDVFYTIDIIIFFCGIYKKRKGGGKRFGACRKPRTSDKNKVLSTTQRYQLVVRILPRILVSLPIPEICDKNCKSALLDNERTSSLDPFCVYSGVPYIQYFDPFYGTIIITPFQYILRISLIYRSQRWRRFIRTTTGRRLKPLLDFFPFILASYLFGALCYRLAVQRQIYCWKIHCKDVVSGISRSLDRLVCRSYNKYFLCPSGDKNMDERYKNMNTTRLNELCPTKTSTSDSKVFDFGIYLHAVQSNVTGSDNVPLKISQSFWWALRNLSSFGSNLSTSMNFLEILFSVLISICGMALFLVYLNARVQESRARSTQLKLKKKKHLMKPNIDLWLSKNDIANMKRTTKYSKDLKTVMKKKKDLKTVIVENIDRLEENKEIDLQMIISVLPIKFKKSITRLLCLATLKKVPTPANLNDKMFRVFCEHLQPVVYSEGNYIVEEGKPLGMMLFITQGLAWSYTTKYINGVTSSDSSSNEWLKQGDFYGEELLNWAFKSPSFSALPISTRTVMSQEKVEAFALMMKCIVRKFWWHFTRELEQVDLEQWENLAASSIQGGWRKYRLAKARRSKPPKRSNRWDKFSVEY